MTTVQPKGESLRKAVKYISDIRTEKPEIDLKKLVDEASFKFDLSPKDTEFLTRFVKEESEK